MGRGWTRVSPDCPWTPTPAEGLQSVRGDRHDRYLCPEYKLDPKWFRLLCHKGRKRGGGVLDRISRFGNETPIIVMEAGINEVHVWLAGR